MVRLLLVASLLFGSSASAARLTAQLDRSTIALGEALSLTVEARGTSLDAFDTAALGPAFEVFSRTLSRAGDTEILVLTLYPRHAGRLTVPPLTFGVGATRPLAVSVTEGNERIPRVTAHWSLQPTAPSVGQPARLSLEICDDGSLQWRRPVLPTQSGLSLRPLLEDRIAGERDGEPCTLQRFHWAILATRPGAAGLELPMLDATRFGERLRFPGPALNFEAAPLPAWLPQHVPPVEPVVVAEPLPPRWPLGRPLGWRFEVTGGYGADGLKALLAPQLRDSAKLGLYPPLVEAVEADDPNSPLTRYAVTLFWQPRASGDVPVPTLSLPWYDPVRGRLGASVLQGRAVTVFDPRWQRAGQVAGAAAAFLLLVAAGWALRRAVLWRLGRRRGLRAIRAATDLSALAQALRGFSLRGAGPATSLGEWRRRLAVETAGGDAPAALDLLEANLYGQGATDLDLLKPAFLQALSRVRPGKGPRHRP